MIWDTFMYRDEASMLQLRFEQFWGWDVTHILVEAPWTHRAVPKPLHFTETRPTPQFLDQARLVHVVDDWQPDPAHAWTNEHHQRNQAWKIIEQRGQDDDWVLIADLDEIPSPELLGWLSGHPGKFGPVFSVWMRTFLFAADWEVAYAALSARGTPLPATCVVASVKYLREAAKHGEYLAEVRDGRDKYEQINVDPAGWHFSWLGGPEAQAAKLATATCHTEILNTPEAELIRSGARWRSSDNGGGLPVLPVDVDETWPPPFYERRVPANWFRPR